MALVSTLSDIVAGIPSGSSQNSQRADHIRALQPEYFQIGLEYPVKLNRQILPKPGRELLN
jgi:hypothetical protein